MLGEARSIAGYGIQVEGAEGLSGQNQWYTDWEVTVPMQLQRGGRLGSRPTYAAPWIRVQKSRLYENSDLRSKWNNGTAYILADDPEQVRLLRQGDVVQVYSNTALWGRCIVQDKNSHKDKVIRDQPLDSMRDDQR